MSALLVGAEMRYRGALGHMFSAMAVTAKILLALMPVALFLILSRAPTTGSRVELRFAHACLLLTHLAVLAGAGVVGNLRLYADLKACRRFMFPPTSRTVRCRSTRSLTRRASAFDERLRDTSARLTEADIEREIDAAKSWAYSF